jgi:hypothetical protein
MLAWLFPRPPVDLTEKTWVETRMGFLAEQFGWAHLLDAPVWSPTAGCLLGTCDGTCDGARRLMVRLCDHLRIDPRGFALEPLPDASCRGGIAADCPAPPSDTPTRGTVLRVASSELADPVALAGTLARQLVGSLLARDASPGGGDPRDGAWLRDLTAVFFGLGIPVANAALHETTRAGSGRCGAPRQVGYLPARMTGYAMALFAYLRDDSRPAWRNHLRLDAMIAFTDGLRYLRRTGDSLLTRDTIGRSVSPRRTEELVGQLAARSPTARVAALWELRDPCHAAEAAEPVARCLHDKRPAIREEAIKTLAWFGPRAAASIPRLIEMLDDARFSIRAAAAGTLGTLGQDLGQEPGPVIGSLADLLEDPDREVVLSAARALSRFGPQAKSSTQAVLVALRGAIIRCDHALIDALTHALYTMDPDPTRFVLEHFADDHEFREQAIHMIVHAISGHEAGNAEGNHA